jgi:membrane protease YdiL (CAAX protease family)
MQSVGRPAVESVAGRLDRRPLATSTALLVGLAAVRAADVLLFDLHVRLGTLAPSAVAMLAVGAWLAWATREAGLPSLAVDRRSLTTALAVGGVGVGAVQVLARALEVVVLSLRGAEPVLVVRPENPATVTTDPIHVGAYLLFGVVVTAVGEELFFRRAVLGSLARRRSFWRANALHAVLFGAWHFAWPLAYHVGPAEPYPPVPIYAFGLLAVTATVGLLYGWLVRTTGTLWTTVVAHLLHNAAVVVLHVRTVDGDVRGSVVAATLLAGYLLVALWAHRRYG